MTKDSLIILNSVLDELLNDELDYLKLKSVLEKYKTILLEFSQLDRNNLSSRNDIQFDNGIALGTFWAALCIDDLIRTR